MFEYSLSHYQKKKKLWSRSGISQVSVGSEKQKQNPSNQPKFHKKKKPTQRNKQKAWRKELRIYDVVSYGSSMFACARGRNV